MGNAAPFALFVSSVDGCPVTRFGTRTLIGAARRVKEPTVIDYTPELVVAITTAEFSRYRREYLRALGNATLKRRTIEEWQAQQPPPEQPPAAPENV